MDYGCFNSSKLKLWSILGLIKNLPHSSPFVISLFCGESKPKPINVYFNDFVEELNLLFKDGLTCYGRNYKVHIHSFVCDSLARAFIKFIKSHSGFASCEKCIKHGQYFNNKVILKNVSVFKRTDSSFRLQLDEEHHVGESPLLPLRIDFINDFPIDYMHCVCLGQMKMLLNTWLSGPLSTRLSSKQVNLISEHLINLSKYLSSDFNQKTRSLHDLPRWKATELRTFLLYVGPVVLKDIVNVG